MKNPILWAVLTLFAGAFTSCKKSTIKDGDTPPGITARIARHVTQPVDAQLGDSTSFATGSKLVIYVPYQIQNDDIDTAYLEITDQQNQVVASSELLESFDYQQDGLNVPDELQNKTFLFAIIDIEDFFANKKFNIVSHVKGNSSLSNDRMDNAFSVYQQAAGGPH